MSKEQKRRAVFQEHGSASPVETDPPFHPAKEEQDVGNDDEIRSVEKSETIVASESETRNTPDALRNGWRIIGLEQQTGQSFLVTHDLEAEGVRAFWRKTRSLSHNKWVLHGKWTHTMAHTDILPEPRYFREIA